MEALKSPAEQRVLLRNVSWETYERLIAEREEHPVPRFYYDRGVLEIMSPSIEHEGVNRVIALLIELLAIDLEIDAFDAGQTPFKRADLLGGFEPDSSFYFRDAVEHLRGKTNIELDAGDPPPDLVVEVEVTRSSLDKLLIYARIASRRSGAMPADGWRSWVCNTASQETRATNRSPKAAPCHPSRAPSSRASSREA